MDDRVRETLVTGAVALGVRLDEAALGRFAIYLELLRLWGGKLNLTTRIAEGEAVAYHFLDSLAGARIVADHPDGRIVDLGSGAGFPGLPLKIALPGLSVLLVESVRKKIAFCQEVIRKTGLDGIAAAWGRGEELGRKPEHQRSFDWAVSRAVGTAADLARLSLPFLSTGGRILLYKAGLPQSEVRDLEAFCAGNGASFRIHPATVPGIASPRSLVVVSPSL